MPLTLPRSERNVGEGRGERQSWTLFPDCGHLLLSQPSSGNLSPPNRILEILPGDHAEPCLNCIDPSLPSQTIRELLALNRRLCKDDLDRSRDNRRGKNLRAASAHHVSRWELDNRFLEGIIEGAKAEPIYHVVYQNHFWNEHGRWVAEMNRIAAERETPLPTDYLPEKKENLDFLLDSKQHEFDCQFSFAQGKFVGQSWADSQKKAISAAQLGPQLPGLTTWQVNTRKPDGLPILQTKPGVGTQEQRRARRQHLDNLVRMGEVLKAEKKRGDKLSQGKYPSSVSLLPDFPTSKRIPEDGESMK